MTRIPLIVQALLIPLVFLALSVPASAASKFDLTAAQRARIEKFLPHTYPKLVQHAPVNITLLGDSVTGMYVHDDNNNDTLKSYGGVFAAAIADQFYYTGGIRVDHAFRGTPEKTIEIHGPEVTIRNASRGGKLMIHALNQIDTSIWDDAPDLVIVNFGVNDANSFYNLAKYRRAAQDVIDAARKHNADVIMLGCTLTLTDPPEYGLALTRPYVDTVHEIADKNGVFFADLGDVSWLIRVDEAMKDLEKPAPKKPAPAPGATPPPPDTKQPEGATPGSIIKFPTADELDPDPDKRAARLFHAVSADLRAWYDHGTQTDLIHPNSHLHRLLGRRLFAELKDGPRKVPWEVGPGVAEFKDADTFTLTYKLENTTDAPMRMSILPLITANWKPQDAETAIELKPQRKGPLTVTYTRMSPPSGYPIPTGEDILRLPIMVVGSGVARIEQVRSLIQPFTVMWDMNSQYNVDGAFTLTAQVVNSNGDDLVGTWEAEWLGQKLTGKVSVPAHDKAPVALHFKLPPDSSKAIRQRGTLNFSVAAHGMTLPFNHEIEIVQNLGLKETVPLLQPEEYVVNQPHPLTLPDATHPGVTFRADADPKALYLTWDFVGMNLAEDANGHAVTFEMNIDARSYGKRLGRGVTDAMRFLCGAADGDGDVTPMQVWCFGNGYSGQRVDTSLAQSHLSSRPDGSRRFTVMLPRSYFHLHEWALGNGNSELGFNMTLLVWQKGDDKNPGGTNPYLYSDTMMHRDDAEALNALELSEHPTKRWTVHFY